MNRLLSTLVASFLVVGLVAPLTARAAEKALCVVCKVKHGEAEEETVKAWRTHEGTRYGFCSESCAEEFEADPAAYLPPTFPRPAPDLSLTDLNGAALDWKSLEGKVVLVDFWATWCAPCRKSMPRLQALHDRYANRGFTVLGVSIDQAKDAPKVKRFASTRKITYPIAIDGAKGSVWERFAVKAVPAAFLVDANGQIVAQWTGAPDETDLEKRLVAMLDRAP